MNQRTILFSVVCSLTFLAPALPQETIGWRTDGTGRYPKADPPKEWGLNQNVVWKTKMPSFSVATPVIVGAKIFTTSDPTSFICVNKADGKILWEKQCSRDEIPWTADEKEKLSAEREQAAAWGKRIQAIQKTLTPLDERWKTEKTRELRKEIDDLNKERNELDRKRRALPLLQRVTDAPKHPTPGYSMCTPVCNGKQIFVGFGNGLVACYDLDGTRRWLKLMEHSTAAFGHGTSPTLVGDKLIVHYADLAALNIKDGSEAWRVKISPLHGTCIPAKIGDTDVVFHPTGRMIRVADGAILADQLGQCGENSPVLHDGIVYYVGGGARAIRLPATPTDKVESLWKGNVKGSGYWFASPIYHDGLIYAVSQSGPLNILDAKTGKTVYADRLDISGSTYPSICQAGKYIYVSDDVGTTVVLEPGREAKEIARNTLEQFRSTPVFEGRRMYVRTQKHLWCIGE